MFLYSTYWIQVIRADRMKKAFASTEPIDIMGADSYSTTGLALVHERFRTCLAPPSELDLAKKWRTSTPSGHSQSQLFSASF